MKGNPAKARQPMNIRKAVTGILVRMPDIFRKSSWPPNACITEPAVRKSKALKNAWVNRWKTPPTVDMAPTPRNM